MPPTYTSNNKIKKIATGDETGTWGTSTNTNFDLYDTAIDGVVSISLSGTSSTLTISDGAAASPDGRNKILILGGSPSGTHTITVSPNSVEKHYFIQNNTNQSVIITQGSGGNVTIAAGYSSVVYCDGAGSGAAVAEVFTKFKTTEFSAGTYTSAAALAVKPGTNSTSAIAFQTSGGTQIAAIDSTNSRFGVGSIAPTAPFSVSGANSISAPFGTGIHLIGDGITTSSRISIDGVGNAGWFLGRLCLGTASSPSAVLSSAFLSGFVGRGYLTSAYSTSDLGQVAIQAEENYTNSTAATGIAFSTTAPGSVVFQQVARIDGGGRFIIGQQVAGGLGNQASGPSVGIELQSTTRAILLSRMTTTQRNAMTAIKGMIIYNTDTDTFQGCYQISPSVLWKDL